MANIIIFLLGALSIYLVRLLRALSSETLLELKRQARAGDIKSAKLYKLKSSYTSEPEVLIIIISLFTVSFMSLLITNEHVDFNAIFLMVFAYAVILIFGFIGEQSVGAASSIVFIFEGLLKIMGPVLKYPAKVLNKLIIWGPKKSLSSKAEILSLVEKNSPNSKLSIQEKKAIQGALTYGDKLVKDVMIPNSVVKQINDTEVLSPVVVSELHDSGYSRFPVYADSKNVVGTLFIKDAVNLKNNKQVKDVMRSDVYYLNEEQTLQDALKAFLKTKHHLFMVVNAYEDIVGIVTIEDVLEQIIGEKIIDEFDQYDDLKVMAEKLAQQKREDRS